MAAITVQDIRNVEALAARPDVLDVLARSLAPSIYGHALIKKGLVLLLLGGRRALQRLLRHNVLAGPDVEDGPCGWQRLESALGRWRTLAPLTDAGSCTVAARVSNDSSLPHSMLC